MVLWFIIGFTWAYHINDDSPMDGNEPIFGETLFTRVRFWGSLEVFFGVGVSGFF